jgi:hypothetical protein
MKVSLKSPSRVYGGGYFMVDPVANSVVGDSWFRTYDSAHKHWVKTYKRNGSRVLMHQTASAFDFMVKHGIRFFS